MEHVLVIPRALFDKLGSFQGFQPEADRYLPAMLDPGNNFFMERPTAELDPTHKQLIPYSIFHHAGRLLCYTRGGKSGEKRLVAKRSVGIGGHINPVTLLFPRGVSAGYAWAGTGLVRTTAQASVAPPPSQVRRR